jgi:hypothetical protein
MACTGARWCRCLTPWGLVAALCFGFVMGNGWLLMHWYNQGVWQGMGPLVTSATGTLCRMGPTADRGWPPAGQEFLDQGPQHPQHYLRFVEQWDFGGPPPEALSPVFNATCVPGPPRTLYFLEFVMDEVGAPWASVTNAGLQAKYVEDIRATVWATGAAVGVGVLMVLAMARAWWLRHVDETWCCREDHGVAAKALCGTGAASGTVVV